jgi:Tetratricopeptide repeat
LFRLLPASPGPDISAAATAVLAGLPPAQARAGPAALARAHLAEPAPGAPRRWRMHDLLRLHGRRLCDQHADDDGRERARDRLLGYYLDRTRAADPPLRALPGTAAPGPFADRDEAPAWLDAERPVLNAAVGLAASTGRDQLAMLLPRSLAEYLDGRRRFDDKLAITAASRDAARPLADRADEASTLNNLGLALREVRRFDQAITAHQQDLAICRETGEQPR